MFSPKLHECRLQDYKRHSILLRDETRGWQSLATRRLLNKSQSRGAQTTSLPNPRMGINPAHPLASATERIVEPGDGDRSQIAEIVKWAKPHLVSDVPVAS